MALQIADNGKNNTILIPDDVLGQDGTILLEGNDNVIEISSGCSLTGARITLGNGSRLHIKDRCRLAALEVYCRSEGVVQIGRNCKFTWYTRLYLHEKGKIDIGQDCLFASDSLISVSDMHTIFDRETGRRINLAKDITLEDHVWLGERTTVLKGVTIGGGSAVGVGSIVTKSIPPFCLSAGIPARVLRTNVSWDEALRPE